MIRVTEPELLRFADDSRFPNSDLPVLLYRDCVPEIQKLAADDVARGFESLFESHIWRPEWRDGIYDYHHYHSTAHEALAVFSGNATLMLGGPKGTAVEVGAGEVLVLPAGTGHCAIRQSADFQVVGAYPAGQHWDVTRGEPDERPAALERISAVPLPAQDPIGGLRLALWRQR